MTNAPIIRIPVDDSSFKAFVDLFNKYSEKLEAMPAEWQALNEAMGESGAALDKGASSARDALAIAAASTTAIVEAIALAAKGQDEFTRSTKAGVGAMDTLGRSVKGVVSGVMELGRTVLKFGALGGLAGIGGAIGLDDLAGSALNAQKNAAGLGLNVGQMRAFQANMREYVGDNVLQGAAGAQVDPSKYGLLAALGINGAQAANENAAALATQEINAVRAAWKRNPSLLTAQSQAALQLGFTVSDIRNVGAANGANLAGSENAANNGAGLGFSAATAHAWAQLSIQLQKAGYTVQSALIDGLEPLAPMLTKLSGAASDAIAALLKSPQLKADLTDLTTWLESPKFKQDVTDFITGFDTLAGKVKGWLQFFGLWPGGGSSPTATNTPDTKSTPWGANLPSWLQPIQPGAPSSAPVAAGSYRKVMSDFMKAGYSQNFAADMASNAYSESMFDPSIRNVNPKTGEVHAGMYQWSATRRAQILAGTGIDVWKDFDVSDQDSAAVWELRNTYKTQAAQIAAVTDGKGLYKGMDRANAGGIAVDNLYEGSGDNFIKQAIRGARAHIFANGYNIDPSVPHPAPTPAISPATLARIARQGNQPQAVKVSITNSTSARVSVSANAAAYG